MTSTCTRAGANPETALHPKRTCKCEQHTGNEHWQGTRHGYDYHRCRCERCRAANTAVKHDEAMKARVIKECGGCHEMKPMPRNHRFCSVACSAARREPLTHGMSRHPLYGTHNQMMWRCYHSNAKRFDRYGGRGISVYEPWHDVAVFIEWIEANLGPRPEGHTLDRIDNDGDYEPGNLRWADQCTQMRNSSRWAA